VREAGRRAAAAVMQGSKRSIFLVLCALVLVGAQGAVAAEKAPLVSEVRGLTPPIQGLEVSVVDGDYQLSLENKSGKTVIVEGYDGESYLRFLPDGTVQENKNSAAKYVNADRFGQTAIPDNITPESPVKWQPVASDGSYKWIDHRIHLTERGTPPQVKDPAKRTKIFDWRVPLEVNGERVRALGTLTWAPGSDSSGGSSAPLIAGLVAAGVAVLAAALLLLRRWRGRLATAPGDREPKEAW
jgi:hypothetical protein